MVRTRTHAQGKLLALELLVKVVQNPQHRWSAVRPGLTAHLRRPLCLALLRNCAAAEPAPFQVRIAHRRTRTAATTHCSNHARLQCTHTCT